MFTKRHSIRPVLEFDEALDMTEQSHKDSVSIRSIIKSYTRTGFMPEHIIRAGQYMDAISGSDYVEAHRILADAQSLFESVPSSIRADFDNNPAKFLDFLQTAENRDKMIKYGFDVSHLPEPPAPAPSSEVS